MNLDVINRRRQERQRKAEIIAMVIVFIGPLLGLAGVPQVIGLLLVYAYLVADWGPEGRKDDAP